MSTAILLWWNYSLAHSSKEKSPAPEAPGRDSRGFREGGSGFFEDAEVLTLEEGRADLHAFAADASVVRDVARARDAAGAEDGDAFMDQLAVLAALREADPLH